MTTPLLGHVDGKRARHNPFVTAVYGAATSSELEQALRTLAQHLGASPGSRKRLGKGYVIDVGVSKRASNAALWTREVAVAFAGVLATFSLGPNESVGAPPAVSNDPAVRYDGGVETDSITVLLGEGQTITPHDGGALVPAPDAGPGPAPHALAAGDRQRSRRLSFAALFDTEKRRRRLLWFQLFITTVLVLLLAGSFATGRDFGYYYTANIAMTVWSLVAVYVSWSKKTFNHRVINLLVIADFFFIVVGTIMWFVYLPQVKDKLIAYCEDPNNETVCIGHSLSDLTSAAQVAVLISTVAYVLAYLFGLRAAYDYAQAMRQARRDQRHVPFDHTVDLLGQFFVPGAACVGSWRHVGVSTITCCGASMATCLDNPCQPCTRACGACVEGSLECGDRCIPDGVDGGKCCILSCCAVTLITAVISSIICVASQSTVACVIAEFTIRGMFCVLSKDGNC